MVRLLVALLGLSGIIMIVLGVFALELGIGEIALVADLGKHRTFVDIGSYRIWNITLMQTGVKITVLSAVGLILTYAPIVQAVRAISGALENIAARHDGRAGAGARSRALAIPRAVSAVGKAPRKLRSLAGYMATVLIAFLPWLALQPAASIIIAPYYVHHTEFFGLPDTHMQTRFNKVESIKKTGKFNGYLIADSRGWSYDTNTIKDITGKSIYNFFNGADHPFAYHLRVSWLIDNKHIDKGDLVVISIAYNQFFPPAHIPDLDWVREHPDISGAAALSFYFAFLDADFGLMFQNMALRHAKSLLSPEEIAALRRDHQRRAQERARVINAATARPVLDSLGNLSPARIAELESLITKGHDDHKRHVFGKPPTAAPDVPMTPGQVRAFRQMMDKIRGAGVEYVCLVPPSNSREQIAIAEDRYVTFLRLVVQACRGAWDFSGFNRVTMNDDIYWDTTHFFRRVADRMFRRMLDPANRDRFGVFVRPDDTDHHVAAYRAALHKALKSGTARPMTR